MATLADTRDNLMSISLRRLPGIIRDPLAALEKMGAQADGRIVRVNLGLFRPYIVSSPEHVRHITRDNSANYPRRGMMWRPFSRVVGNGIAGEGPDWETSRGILQKAFGNRNIVGKSDEMAALITEAVDRLDEYAGTGRHVDAGVEMTRIVQRVINLIFFGGRIDVGDGERLAEAVGIAMRSFVSRILLPSVPLWVPMPGDRVFRRAKNTIDEILRPIVTEARERPTDGTDAVSLLLGGRNARGEPLTDQQISEDIVALYVASSESTAVALTWLWVVLDAHPSVADRMRAEIDEVIGDAPLRGAHVRRLKYTAKVLNELLRIHSVGWIVPRTAHSDDVIDGVPIPAGSIVVISPYLTHRLPELWKDPAVFDPERLAPDHPLAHLAFGDGRHQCLGQAFFQIEATLIIAAILRRYQLRMRPGTPVDAHVSLTVQPRQRIPLTVHHRP
jgi:cytochrome P450